MTSRSTPCCRWSCGSPKSPIRIWGVGPRRGKAGREKEGMEKGMEGNYPSSFRRSKHLTKFIP